MTDKNRGTVFNYLPESAKNIIFRVSIQSAGWLIEDQYGSILKRALASAIFCHSPQLSSRLSSNRFPITVHNHLADYRLNREHRYFLLMQLSLRQGLFSSIFPIRMFSPAVDCKSIKSWKTTEKCFLYSSGSIFLTSMPSYFMFPESESYSLHNNLTSAFPGAVWTDKSYYFAPFYLKWNIIDSPEVIPG